MSLDMYPPHERFVVDQALNLKAANEHLHRQLKAKNERIRELELENRITSSQLEEARKIINELMAER